MSELRSTDRRKADVRAALERNGDGWLATAGSDRRAHLIAVSTWWDGARLIVATREKSRTARNLADSRRARLALGSADDAIMLDLELLDSPAAAGAPDELTAGFVAANGWNPAEEGPDWRYYVLRPLRIQAYRGYGELDGRDVMRDGNWLE